MANQIQNVGFSAYSAEQADIERRRAYAQALQAQGAQPLGPTEMVGGWAVKRSPLEGLAKMLQAYGGRRGQEDASEAQKALAARMQGDRTADMGVLAQMLKGTPGGLQADAADNVTQMPARAPGIDPAMLGQLRSPEVRSIGERLWAEQMKPKEIKAYKPGDVLYQGGSQVGAIPAAPKFHTVGGSLVPEPAAPGAQVQPVYTSPDKDAGVWGDPYNLGGATVQKNSRTGEIRAAVSRPPVTNVNTTITPPGKVFENENKLRDDYTTASKPFIGIRDAYNTIKASLEGPITAVSTLAGATKFMKMIDPESVVRESELNMALRASGMLDRFMNLHNTVMKGQVLTPTQAKEIKTIAESLYKAAEKQQKRTDDYFKGLATEYGLKPERVIRDQSAASRTDDKDAEALAWANANPGDPRAAAIKQRLGVR